MKIFASNFTNRLATGGTIKNAKLGRKGVTWPIEFLDPLHISATVEDRNFKFGTQINLSEDASSDHQRGFAGGLATLYYKSKMAAEAMLDSS